MGKNPILEIKDLRTYFYTDEGIVKACDGVNFKLYEGETLAIVGESGSGKSVTSMSILQLIESPPGKIVSGEILYENKNLLNFTEKEMEKIRGNNISMIFQEPMTSLNPVLTIGYQIMEALKIHENLNKRDAKARAIELLELVGIPAPAERINEYPAKMSGGMRQRVMIAIALACNPKILIADEPTSALDVTIQEQLIKLIKRLQRERNMSVILITHDLGVVAEIADKVAVMYCGQIVEYGSCEDIFYNGKHPYVEGLKKCIPRLDIEQEELFIIEGMVPNPLKLPAGCKFQPRCDKSIEICKIKEPSIINFDEQHFAACWLYDDGGK